MALKFKLSIDPSKFATQVQISKIRIVPDLFDGLVEVEYKLVRNGRTLATKTLQLPYVIKVVKLKTDNLQDEATKIAKEMNGYVLAINEQEKTVQIGIGDFFDLAFSTCNQTLYKCTLQQLQNYLQRYLS